MQAKVPLELWMNISFYKYIFICKNTNIYVMGPERDSRGGFNVGPGLNPPHCHPQLEVGTTYEERTTIGYNDVQNAF